MNWEFTPDHILKGEVVYTLRDYRNDLWEEVESHTDQRGFEGLFWTLYHLAMGYTPKQMASMFKRKNDLSPEETREQLEQFELMAGSHQNEVEMLKAIIKRQIVEYKQEGQDIFQDESLVDHMRQWVEETVESHHPGDNS